MSPFNATGEQWQMMEGSLLMSRRERNRLAVLAQVKCGELKLVTAGAVMGVTYRQAKRVWQRYRVEGDAGLVHRSRGRPSARRKPLEFRQRVLARYKERYEDFGPTLAAEYLAGEGLAVDHETLRRWLIAQGTRSVRRRGQRHRAWRERRACFGMMVQLDGSHHDWFEGRRAQAVLMVVWSKNSCGLPVVEFKQTAQALTGADFTTRLADPVRWRWKQNHIRLPLMVSFVVKMVSVIGKHMAKGGLPEQDQLRQALLFHRAIPALQMRVQVWASRRQHQRFDPCGPEDVIKGGRELRISIVQQVTATIQNPISGHRHVSSHLLHPVDIGRRRESGDTDPVRSKNSNWAVRNGLQGGRKVACGREP